MISGNKKVSTMHWILLLISITAIWTGSIFAVNYTVDPFGVREWIAEKKYKPIVHERSEKYNYIFHQNNIQQYDCVILGSSRVMSMVPSSDTATKEGCYNFGVHTANNAEKLFILQEWLKQGKLKEVYLGNELHNVHPWMNPLELNPRRFTQGSEGNYLSYSTFKISFKVLKNSFLNQPQTYFRPDGSIHYFQDEQNIKNNKFDHTRTHFQQLSVDAVRGNFIEHPFMYETKALEPLREIKALCDRHHIKLYSFITPMYSDARNELYAHPSLRDASKLFRQDLVTIFGEVYDFDIPSPENNNPTNFYDSVHYRPVIGDKMLHRMHHQKGYGSLLKMDPSKS